MRRLLTVAIVAGLIWYGWGKYHEYSAAAAVAKGSSLAGVPSNAEPDSEFFPAASSTTATSTSVFKCDGRTYCSQMTSCAEATYFIRNCPDTKMDGNNDGVPCEKQWCK
jgi:hypothetical protein